jgi:steroid delta-isomerase-like uncharacterized protein
MSTVLEKKASLAEQIWNGEVTPEVNHTLPDRHLTISEMKDAIVRLYDESNNVAHNLAVVSRIWNEIWNKGALDASDEVFTKDYLGHLPIMTVHGPEEFKNMVKVYLMAFPDVHLTVEDAFATGDRVTVRWISRGTHLGAMMGFPPSQNKIEVMGISIFRMAGSQVAEEWEGFDTLGMMQQIGAIPQPTQ